MRQKPVGNKQRAMSNADEEKTLLALARIYWHNGHMGKEVKAEVPKVELATKDWAIKELMDTERRIEKAFHEQTQFLSLKTDGIQKAFQEQTQSFQEQTQFLSQKIDNNVRWMIGLIVTMTIAIILAVLFKN